MSYPNSGPAPKSNHAPLPSGIEIIGNSLTFNYIPLISIMGTTTTSSSSSSASLE